jgi:hypothetical protein
VGKLSPQQRDNIMYGWESLLYSGEVGNKLAKDLFKYAYYRNGFSFGPNTWMHLAPVEVKKEINNYIDDLYKLLNTKTNETNANMYEAFWG